MPKKTTRFGYITAGSAVAGSVTLVLPANRREEFSIQNNGPGTVYFGFGTAVSAGTSLILPPNISYTGDRYCGPVYALAASGTSILELKEMCESAPPAVIGTAGMPNAKVTDRPFPY